MANAKNIASVADLKERFGAADSIVLTEYRGLTVQQLAELRGNLGFDVDLHVAKNTLIKIAATEQGIDGLDEHLVGPTAVAFIKGEAVDAAKVMKDFAKNHEAFVVKGGYMDGNALSADQVKAIADLDNRETTLAKIAGAMKGNLSKAAGLFNAPASKAARAVSALQDKKQSEGEN
ncbi:50S ribosomal protein L10 [Corynebacterium guangdongense]|uniref:Large ribosomal subunit protein uL10 n=1 Tax=Corynebacterium guangdongense TaxID=1783348 RepID=A0ABU1ZW74_9CORY|nr:50S ribosomal protein L10 [Corynebacterium guangdongense]MDR7328482.1 large subunit ribosomal protein L10 [Corynebacterium guangdongense]WJZ17059.1 50S ribosomal protein L10 [Corynebacterium guangdongense]